MGVAGRSRPGRVVMDYTVADMEGFAALAGEDLSWTMSKGGHRPTGAKGFRAALREDIAVRQGGICPECGEPLDETAEFCHLVARGKGLRGWFPRNIMVGHALCNEAQKIRGAVVHPDTLARPDLVPDEWTPFPILKRYL